MRAAERVNIWNARLLWAAAGLPTILGLIGIAADPQQAGMSGLGSFGI